jgi:hypothetical protein
MDILTYEHEVIEAAFHAVRYQETHDVRHDEQRGRHMANLCGEQPLWVRMQTFDAVGLAVDFILDFRNVDKPEFWEK